MSTRKALYILTLLGLVLAFTACQTPSATPEPTDSAPVEKAATAMPEEQSEAEPAPFAYPVLDSAYSVSFTEAGISFTTAAGIHDTLEDFTAAMQAMNCQVAAETRGEDGARIYLFTCRNAQGELLNAFNVAFGSGSFGSTVSYLLSSPRSTALVPPIPDNAEDVVEHISGASFYLAEGTVEILDFYAAALAEKDCTADSEVGSPTGFYISYICTDESGVLLSIGIGISEIGEQTNEVSIEVNPLLPNSVAVNPEVFGSLSVTENGELAFRTEQRFEDAYTLFSTDMAAWTSASDCKLVSESGGAGNSTAMKYLCTDYYSADHSYQFFLTIGITGIESGVEGVLSYELVSD